MGRLADPTATPVADTVITGALVWAAAGDLTGPVSTTPREASVAIGGGRILAVGDQDAVLDLAGPGTRRLHLPGRLVLPGFQDAHVHPPFAGRYRLHLSLHHLATTRACLDAIRAYAAAHPDLPWIFGAGWPAELLPGAVPARALLDTAVPDRPVFLFDAGIHSAWVNSRALELAGIDAATPDPADGRYRRDPATGEPTGLLDEGAAYGFEDRYLPTPDRAEWQAAILNAQAHLHALGVTGWQDAWVAPDVLDAYASLVDDGRLTARVVAALWWERAEGLEQVERFVQQRASGARGDRLLPRTVKIMVDGVVENGTAGLLSPYHHPCGGVPGGMHGGFDGLPGAGSGDRGSIYLEPGRLAEAVTMLDRLGFQVHLHTIGDRAVRIGLDAVAAALAANGRRDNRHHLAHVQVIHPDDVPRFAALGAIANCQAFWAQSEPLMDELTIPVLGADRARSQYPFADLAASGAVLAMGSDWAVSTADPLQQIEVAVTRVNPEQRAGTPFLPGQRLTLGTALRAFTAGSAFVNHDPDGGTLRVGARADLVVLNRNLFAHSGSADHGSTVRASAGPFPVEGIADTRVEYTVASGHLVWAADGSHQG